jgi:hypothetical protein
LHPSKETVVACRHSKTGPKNRAVSQKHIARTKEEVVEQYTIESSKLNKEAERLATKIIRNMSATQRSQLLSAEKLHVVQKDVESALHPFENKKLTKVMSNLQLKAKNQFFVNKSSCNKKVYSVKEKIAEEKALYQSLLFVKKLEMDH